MPLPAPNLDDRRFQDLVDDAKRLVQQRCPEWTDHNVSDPGVTLIETFAFMVDQLLYRLNRVPDRHYVKFLELIGIRLFPPVAARADVTFWLSAPIPRTVSIPLGTEVSTVRTELEEAVVFRVDDVLDIVPCSLQTLASQDAAAPQGAPMRRHTAALEIGRGGPSGALGNDALPCFAEVPQPGDAFYIGLSDPVPRCAVVVRLGCHIEGIGVDPTRPPLRWEAYDGNGWRPCELDADTTGGLNRDGEVVVHVPRSHTASVIDGERAGWLRAVVTTTVEDQPAYSASPRIDSAQAFTIGGTTSSVHAELVHGEVLGVSEGVPGQRFPVEHGPIVPDDRPTHVEVSEGSGWRQWTEVESFAGSGPDDPHVLIDRRAGEVVLGPLVRQGDGSLCQFGAVPQKGATVRLPRYATGGGSQGNVAKRTIAVLRSTIPFVSSVENRWAAVGGVDGESVEEAKVRGPLVLRTRNRAVTAEDYEQLAREAAPEVVRVRCVRAPRTDGSTAGARVLVVPAVDGDELGRLRFDQLIPPASALERITGYLDERRVLGARVSVEPPTYQGITVVARVQARPGADPTVVERDAVTALYHYFNPISGGPEGRGWPFGRPVHVGEAYAVLQHVADLDFVEDARLFAADPLTGERGQAVPQIVLEPTSLVFSYEHLLRVEQ